MTKKTQTNLFYGFIGFTASLLLFLGFYWSLRLNASITNLIQNFWDMPLYFWPYVVLTLGTIILFGANIALFVYRWRKFGFGLGSFGKRGVSTGFGSLIGIAASACPVCGSTILSALGIAGGLAAFPLGGLELKAVSFGFMALPVWFLTRDLKKLESDCKNGICPVLQDPSFKEKDKSFLFLLVALAIVLSLIAWNMLETDPVIAKLFVQSGILNPKDNILYTASSVQTDNTLFDETVAKVLPEQGFQSKIVLTDSVSKLVEYGVIDKEKFEAIYEARGGLPPELKEVLTQSSDKPILLTRANANYYVNLMWPIGLANYMESNKSSPVNGKSLFNFASTGGWNLGKEENGGVYFNKLRIIELTPEQEALVTKIAQNTYRPCCNNSTFFQDCNHGSALLGLLQLGAAQGLSEDELYREALAFNSFWFPHNYIQTALYFKAVKNTDWDKVDPKLVMGKDFSAISGWSGTVAKKVNELGLVPQTKGGAACGV